MSTSHKHYNNFGRIYIENLLKFNRHTDVMSGAQRTTRTTRLRTPLLYTTASLYFMAIYFVRVYSIFQAESFGDIFVFLLQILVEFFIITSEISSWTALIKPFILNSSESFEDARALT
jgi:hypothetical protein